MTFAFSPDDPLHASVQKWCFAEVLWSHRSSIPGMIEEIAVLSADPDRNEIRVVRGWHSPPADPLVAVDVDVSSAALRLQPDGFAPSYMSGPFDERGRLDSARAAVTTGEPLHHVLGDIHAVWCNEGAFIALTSRVGEPDKLIAGTIILREGTFVFDIQLDRALDEFETKAHPNYSR